MRPHDLSTLPIIVLAAGQSRRMRGRDKLMEPVGGLPLILRQVSRARAATAGPVLVALPPAPHPRRDALQDLDVQQVDVPDAAEGLSASLRRALTALPLGTAAAMILLADLPELTTDDLKFVLSAVDLAGPVQIWRATTAAGAPGHPIVFSASLFGALSRLTGDSGGAEVIKAHKDTTVHLPLPGNRARLDLDTPEDWVAWRASTQQNAER